MLKPRPRREDFYDTYGGQTGKELFTEADLAWHKEALRVAVEALESAEEQLRHGNGDTGHLWLELRDKLQSIKGEANE